MTTCHPLKLRRDFFYSSKLNDLPEPRFRQLKRWLADETLTYRDIVHLLKRRFGITVKASQVTAFFQRFCSADFLKANMKRLGMSGISAEVSIVFYSGRQVIGETSFCMPVLAGMKLPTPKNYMRPGRPRRLKPKTKGAKNAL
jgi:hypothetical protein